MKVYKNVQFTKKEIAEVKCNKCCKLIEKDTLGNLVDYFSVDKRWGYGTKLDSEEHKFDLCEDCYKEIIDSFLIKVEK